MDAWHLFCNCSYTSTALDFFYLHIQKPMETQEQSAWLRKMQSILTPLEDHDCVLAVVVWEMYGFSETMPGWGRTC